MASYVVEQIIGDALQRRAIFPVHEANFLRAKKMAGILKMHKEDLNLTWGLAVYSYDESLRAQAEERLIEVVEKAHQYGDYGLENEAYNNLAALSTSQERRQFWSQKAEEMWKSVDGLSADAYYAMGFSAHEQGNLETATAYFKRALKIMEQEGNSGIIRMYGVLGNIMEEQGDLDESRMWFQKCSVAAKDAEDWPRLAFSNKRLGLIAVKQSDVAEAFKRYSDALKIYQVLESKDNVADILNFMGELFSSIREYDFAEEYLMESVRIAECIQNDRIVSSDYNALGELSYLRKDYTSAKLWFSKAVEISDRTGDEGNAAISRHNLEIVTAAADAETQGDG